MIEEIQAVFMVTAYHRLTKCTSYLSPVPKQVIDSYKKESDETVREHIRVLLNLISEKNPTKTRELARRDATMSPVLREILKPELDKEKKLELFVYVQDGQMTPEYAAGRSGQSVTEFVSEMRKNGYSVPEKSLAAVQ